MRFSNILKTCVLALAFGSSATTMQAQSVTINPPEGNGICLLGSFDLSPVTCLNGEKVQANKSTKGNGLIVRDTLYTSGVGTHAPSKMIVKTNGATRFVAKLAIDDGAENATDKANHGIVDYEILKHADGNRTGTVVKSGTIDRRDKGAVNVDFDITGWDYITLNFKQGTQAWADHVDIVNAWFQYTDILPETVSENEIYGAVEKVKLPETGRRARKSSHSVHWKSVKPPTDGAQSRPTKA